MHICLHIEGWPIHQFGEGFPKLEAKYGRKTAEQITDKLWDIFSHTEIFQREKLCGFSHFQKQLANNFIKNNLIPSLSQSCLQWNRYWDRLKIVPIETLSVIQVLLAPASHHMHAQLKEGLKKSLALAINQQIEAICRDILKRQRCFPQSIPVAFEDVANILGLPPKLLALDYLDKRDSDLFCAVKRIFRED